MPNDIRVGFTMHPRWIRGTDLKTFLAPLRQAGLSALEFELDVHLDLWNEFNPLMEAASNEGLELSFHAPYRAPHTLTGFTGNQRNAIEQDYRPMFAIAEKWAFRIGKPHMVVIHAATAPSPHDRASLIDDTVAFLTWACEEFPHTRIALENNNPSSKNIIKLGIEHEDVIHLVKSVNRPNIGICWDMGHDYLKKSSLMLTPEWLSRVIHVHIHDVDENGQDHYPLILGNIPFRNWLQALKQSGMKGIVVLELKGERMTGWPIDRVNSALTESISSIMREVS
jgi:sugar phosphate isomerase/epimerase